MTNRVRPNLAHGEGRSASTDHDSGQTNKDADRIIALSTGGAIFIALVLVAGLASAVLPPLRPCVERLAETGEAGVVTVCQPILGEPALLGLVLLLLALLLLPVLSKFDVAGLLSIELKAERAQQEAEEARKLAEAVQKHAEELASVQADLRDVQERLVARSVASPVGEWAAVIRELQSGAQARAAEPPARDEERGELVERLLRAWDQLLPYATMGRTGYARQGPERVAAVTEAGRSAVVDWRRRYRLEIEQVRSVRNQVAHGGPATTADLRRAVELAEVLITSVREWVNRVE